MAQHDPRVVAWIVFIAAAVASSAVQIAIQRDVNRALPKEQRFAFFGWRTYYGQQRMIIKLHRQLYPGDPLPILYWVVGALCIIAYLFILFNIAKAPRPGRR